MAGEDREARLKEKQAFWRDFEHLQRDSDDEPDPGREESIKFLRNGLSKKATQLKPKPSNTTNVARSASDSNLVTANTKAEQVYRPVNIASGERVPATLIQSQTFSGVPSTAMAPQIPPRAAALKVTGKRKRDSATKLVPEADQIFKSLHFYFFPNNDTHPARRMRIAKALDYGATWQKDWNDAVTHVIVDKAMDFAQLTKFLKLDILPPKVILVNESYPAECITFRTMMEPKQIQFRVKGFVLPPRTSAKEADQQPIAAAERPERSLELKPAGKLGKSRKLQTSSPGEPYSYLSSLTRKADEPLPPAPLLEARDAESLTAASTDEFDAAIRQARELQHAPLDIEEEANGGTSTSDCSDYEKSGGLQLMQQQKSKNKAWQDKFSCMQKHTANDPEGPNAGTVAILQQMSEYYDQIGDEWRTRAYRKAMGALRNHPTKVWTKEEALALPQIGDRLATKIEEIAFSNRLRRLNNARADPGDQVLQTFMKVYGAGYATASGWVRQGFTTLDELIEKAELTDNQRIGIDHYEDFNTRIPRAEVAEHGKFVTDALQKIDPAFEVVVGGSYRRGSPTSGDIDCIITYPDTDLTHIRSVVIEKLVPKLVSQNFLVAALATTSKGTGSKWHGASCLPSSQTWRRIDFLFVPSDEMGAALIYFTGNDIFNRSLRLLASRKGMRLNQRGLFRDVMRGKGRERLSEGTLVEGKDEKKIFAALGVPWRPPEHRIC